jgi:hypothetical protein
MFLMTHPILSTATEVTRTAIGTAVSKGLKSPQAMAYFYYNVAKSCYSANESKQISRITTAGNSLDNSMSSKFKNS